MAAKNVLKKTRNVKNFFPKIMLISDIVPKLPNL